MRGELVEGWGDPGQPTYPRSAVKPLQALPLIESGAAGRFGLGDEELALACASHAGQPGHVARVAAWLARIGLDGTALECGAHWPSSVEAARALARQGGEPSALHNNCSGKHSGFLTTARHLGEEMRGYIGLDHPVQRRVAQALGEMADCEMSAVGHGIDGCGIPTYALPLSALAVAMARLADPSGLGAARTAAVARIRTAMAAHPWLVAGDGRLCTVAMRTAPQVLLKGGAEGVYAAALPARGLGVAVKVADGAARAAEVAVLAVLDRLGAFTPEQRDSLAARMRPAVLNVAGRRAGEVRVASVA